MWFDWLGSFFKKYHYLIKIGIDKQMEDLDQEKRKKIVCFFTFSLTPNPRSGMEFNRWELLNRLSNEDIDLHLVSLDFKRSKSIVGDFELTKKRVVSFNLLELGSRYSYATFQVLIAVLTKGRLNKKQRIFFEKIRWCAANCDVVIFEGVVFSSAVRYTLKERNRKTKVIYSVIDNLETRFKLLSASADGFFEKILYKYKSVISKKLMGAGSYHRDVLYHMVSEDEINNWISSGIGRKGFSTGVFVPELEGIEDLKVKRSFGSEEKIKVLIQGSLDVPHVREGVIKCLAALSEKKEEMEKIIQAKICILGPGCEKYLEKENNKLDLEMVEWVDDIAGYVSSFDCVIIPDVGGSGIKNRTVLAAQMGCFCIGGVHAFEGIESIDQDGCYELNSFDEIPCVLLEYYRGRELNRKKSIARRAYIAEGNSSRKVWDLWWKNIL